MLIHGGDGRILKVHYKGQRGEGVYDLNWEGLIKNVERRYRETGSDTMKQEYEQFMRITPCAACHGQRLKQSSLAVTVADKNIYEMTDMSVKDLVKYLAEMQLTEQQKFIGNQILKEIRARVGFLQEVGLDYLTLTRATGTLSGGEAQRIRLATQIGSGLVGVAYILDEPSIGLHQRDNDKLLHPSRATCSFPTSATCILPIRHTSQQAVLIAQREGSSPPMRTSSSSLLLNPSISPESRTGST